jgi:hypothetical protein
VTVEIQFLAEDPEQPVADLGRGVDQVSSVGVYLGTTAWKLEASSSGAVVGDHTQPTFNYRASSKITCGSSPRSEGGLTDPELKNVSATPAAESVS